jgi:hypothetical protein
MDELKFEVGRAVVPVPEADGVWASVINGDRNDFIREAKMWSPSAILHGWNITDAQSDEDTYEVAFVDNPDVGDCVRSHIPTGWEEYMLDDEGWIIFRYVPRSLVHEYLGVTA